MGESEVAEKLGCSHQNINFLEKTALNQLEKTIRQSLLMEYPNISNLENPKRKQQITEMKKLIYTYIDEKNPSQPETDGVSWSRKTKTRKPYGSILPSPEEIPNLSDADMIRIIKELSKQPRGR